MNLAKLDWKKNEKAFYLPGTEPGLVAVPAFKFFSLRGQGNPNSGAFQEYVLEGYTDEATFNSEHRTTRHYAHYAETTAGWVENKSRKVYERFWPED